jgi:hypothetical protein
VDLELSVTAEERTYLRELARKQLEYAHLPVMDERRELWYAHNALCSARPILVMEMGTFRDSILPEPRCTSPAAQFIERQLLTHVLNHELIDDDKVVPDVFVVPWQIHIREFGLDIKRTRARDSRGVELGYSVDHPIVELERDFAKLQPSTFAVDREGTAQARTLAEDVLGDILPVEVQNWSLRWFLTPSEKVVHLMGMQAMLLSLMDTPELMHRLYTFVTEQTLRAVAWMEDEGLMTLDNGNHYAGAGSYGFTDELPTAACRNGAPVRRADVWANLNSQETVGLSPAMYHEFILPHYCQLAEGFGLVYYGCCEPVHSIWDGGIEHLPQLRKVSISPWCDEEFMGERLRGSKVIYSRKPSPNLIGVGTFDPDAYRAHIADTVRAARGCTLEIVHRDIYTLVGDRTRAGRAISIAREVVDELWEG